MARDWIGQATSIFRTVFQAMRSEIERRLLRAGVLDNGLDVLKLQGPLWIHGTITLAFDDTSAAASTPAERYHQAHTLLAVDCVCDTAPAADMTLTLYRLRGRTATALGGFTLAAGAREARLAFDPTADDIGGRGGDLYYGTTAAGDVAVVDLRMFADVRIDVIRGTG